MLRPFLGTTIVGHISYWFLVLSIPYYLPWLTITHHFQLPSSPTLSTCWGRWISPSSCRWGILQRSVFIAPQRTWQRGKGADFRLLGWLSRRWFPQNSQFVFSGVKLEKYDWPAYGQSQIDGNLLKCRMAHEKNICLMAWCSLGVRTPNHQKHKGLGYGVELFPTNVPVSLCQMQMATFISLAALVNIPKFCICHFWDRQTYL